MIETVEKVSVINEIYSNCLQIRMKTGIFTNFREEFAVYTCFIWFLSIYFCSSIFFQLQYSF